MERNARPQVPGSHVRNGTPHPVNGARIVSMARIDIATTNSSTDADARIPIAVPFGRTLTQATAEERVHSIMGQIWIPVIFLRTERISNQIPDRERFGMQQADLVLELSRNGRH
jgi:hypothetical protein